MANVNILTNLLKASVNSSVPLCIWGAAGIGKSSVVKQVAEDLGMQYADIRCALLEPGDLTGLPVEQEEKGHKFVKFLASEFLPQDPKWKGFIFLDEINRASSPVLNAIMQLVLDRKILTHYTLPKGAIIVAACNPSQDGYSVNSLDEALMKRFCHIEFTPSNKDFYDYAGAKGIRSDVLSFTQIQKEVLKYKASNEIFNTITPSQRTIEFLSDITSSLEDLDAPSTTVDACVVEAAQGLLGGTYGVQFAKHRKESIRKVDIEIMLKDFDLVKPQIKDLVKKGKLAEQRQIWKDLRDKITADKTTTEAFVDNKEAFTALCKLIQTCSLDVSVAAFKELDFSKALTEKIMANTKSNDKELRTLATETTKTIVKLVS